MKNSLLNGSIINVGVRESSPKRDDSPGIGGNVGVVDKRGVGKGEPLAVERCCLPLLILLSQPRSSAASLALTLR